MKNKLAIAITTAISERPKSEGRVYGRRVAEYVKKALEAHIEAGNSFGRSDAKALEAELNEAFAYAYRLTVKVEAGRINIMVFDEMERGSFGETIFLKGKATRTGYIDLDFNIHL